MSSRGRVDLLRSARSRGYEVHLIFIAMDSPERCIARIGHRAARGGHFVPDADVRRRYANSGDGPRLVLVAEAGKVMWQSEVVPDWLKL